MAGHIGNITVFQPEAESMPAYLERSGVSRGGAQGAPAPPKLG